MTIREKRISIWWGINVLMPVMKIQITLMMKKQMLMYTFCFIGFPIFYFVIKISNLGQYFEEFSLYLNVYVIMY